MNDPGKLIIPYTVGGGPHKSSYRYLGWPVKGQQLHYLYPGRLMSNQYNHTGYNIPHEDPEGLERTMKDLEEDQKLSDFEDRKIADYLGGGHDIGESPLDPDYPHRGHPDHPRNEYRRFLGRAFGGHHDYHEEKENEEEEESNEVETFEKEPLIGSEPNTSNGDSSEVHHNEPFSMKNHIWIWVGAIILLILLIIGVIFIIHEATKHK